MIQKKSGARTRNAGRPKREDVSEELRHSMIVINEWIIEQMPLRMIRDDLRNKLVQSVDRMGDEEAREEYLRVSEQYIRDMSSDEIIERLRTGRIRLNDTEYSRGA